MSLEGTDDGVKQAQRRYSRNRDRVICVSAAQHRAAEMRVARTATRVACTLRLARRKTQAGGS
jgi:hypothetical protein